MTYDAYCPICKKSIMRPIWLQKKYLAYCESCGRAYIKTEILWKPEKRRFDQRSKGVKHVVAN